MTMLKVVCRWLACVSGVAGVAAAADRPPNVVVMMADDLGWGDVGFNGNRTIKTPHLDDMAAHGLRLTRFYAAAPLCSPTRGSLLTGRYPWRYGVLAAHTGGLRIAEKTIAECAHAQGYRTGFFGKWHLGWVKPEERLPRGCYSPPWHHGFDESFATTSAVPTWNPTVTPAGATGAGNEGSGRVRPGDPWKGGMPYVHDGVEVADNMEGDDSRIIMDRVVPFVRGAVERGQPFLACVWFHAPHEPVVAGPEHRQLYAAETEERQHYFGAITAMDEQVGRLRAELRRLGVERDTIVLFTSDNGPADAATSRGVASAGPFRGHKHTMYEGGIRVPAVVEWPGHVAAGTSSDAVAGAVDLLPTFLELSAAPADARRGPPLDGVSLAGLLAGAEAARTAPLFFGYRRLVKGIDGQALVDGRYKLLKAAVPDGGYELYDVVADPAETRNLTEAEPHVFASLKARMAEYDEACRLSRDGVDYLY